METADALFRSGRLREASGSYVAALSDRPADATLLKRLGDLALYENRADDAVRYLSQAFTHSTRFKRRWPLATAIRAQLGMAHYRSDRFRDASREFAAAAGRLPVGPFRGLAGVARHLAAFGDDRPYRIDGPPVTRLEFVVTDPLPTVELVVNGGPPAKFFLDTGGAEIVLDAGFAAQAGATLVSELSGEYAGRRRARTGLGKVDTIQAGELRISDVPIHTLDLRALPEYFGIDIRGILGTRILMHFMATIDYPGGALILRRGLSQRGGELGRRETTRIPFWLVDTHLILARGSLNDLPPTLFLVDTGLAGAGFLAPESNLRRAGVAVDWSRAREGLGAGGPVTETDVVIDTLTLGEGDHAITHHAVAGTVQKKAPSILGDRLGFDVGGLISHAFLRPHALTLDFETMCLVVDSPSDP